MNDEATKDFLQYLAARFNTELGPEDWGGDAIQILTLEMGDRGVDPAAEGCPSWYAGVLCSCKYCAYRAAAEERANRPAGPAAPGYAELGPDGIADAKRLLIAQALRYTPASTARVVQDILDDLVTLAEDSVEADEVHRIVTAAHRRSVLGGIADEFFRLMSSRDPAELAADRRSAWNA